MEINKIQPIENFTLADRIEQRIVEHIKENNLKPGDALPKEIQLAEWLGVSRTAVREAMMRLRTLGLIESKKHRGMVLKEPDLINSIERILNPQMLDEQTLKDLFEFRLMFEIGLADFIFVRKTEKQISDLEEIAKKSRYEYADNFFSLEDEFAFHSALYKIAGNETLHRFHNLLLPVFQYVHNLQTREPIPPDETSQERVVTHIDLVEELKNGTTESFRAAMRQHLNPHFKRLNKSW